MLNLETNSQHHEFQRYVMARGLEATYVEISGRESGGGAGIVNLVPECGISRVSFDGTAASFIYRRREATRVAIAPLPLPLLPSTSHNSPRQVDMPFFTVPLRVQAALSVANSTARSDVHTAFAPACLVATAVGLRGLTRLGHPNIKDVSLQFGLSRDAFAVAFPAFIRCMNKLAPTVPNSRSASEHNETLKELKVQLSSASIEICAERFIGSGLEHVRRRRVRRRPCAELSAPLVYLHGQQFHVF